MAVIISSPPQNHFLPYTYLDLIQGRFIPELFISVNTIFNARQTPQVLDSIRIDG
jgi:hypothetical protein